MTPTEYHLRLGRLQPSQKIEEALAAVKERVLKGPVEGFVVHLPVIEDALRELLLRRLVERGEK